LGLNTEIICRKRLWDVIFNKKRRQERRWLRWCLSLCWPRTRTLTLV
jgi:hypothetical protein